MRVSKFLSSVIFITCICLLYVHQYTEIFRLAYLGQKKQAVWEDLLDKNSILRYNMGRNASLVQIGSKISDYADFQMPDSCRLVRLQPSREEFRPKEQLLGKETLLARIFGIKRQAEAKTINHQ